MLMVEERTKEEAKEKKKKERERDKTNLGGGAKIWPPHLNSASC